MDVIYFPLPSRFSPTTFSNGFYKELLSKKWTYKKWDGPSQFEDETKSLMMLPTDMSVISGSGLVGRTISVAESTTLVSLLADPSSKVGARIGGKSELGFISGNGLPGELEFEIFDPLAEIQKGDRIVTWGSEGGRPFVAGVPIGEVTSVKSSPGLLTKSARVKPYVKLSTLDLVSVVVEAPRIDPRDSLLPPMPVVDTPTPTTSPSATPSPSEN